LAKRRRRLTAALVIVGSFIVVVAVIAVVLTVLRPAASPQAKETVTRTASPTPTPTPTPSPTFDKTLFSIDDPMSLWVVVDKLRPVNPQGFVPSDLVDANVPAVFTSTLREPAARAVEAMFAAYTAETGESMRLQSAYRSYEVQAQVYGESNQDDATTARPGFSEHQTGLAIDISPASGECAQNECFANTLPGQWLAANAWQYGFLLRYPSGLTQITGYSFEPWHFRFIGTDLAAELHKTGVQTLEEFFGLPPAPDYL
jgi:D-alanyl-D-alanine carboxypeptidase